MKSIAFLRDNFIVFQSRCTSIKNKSKMSTSRLSVPKTIAVNVFHNFSLRLPIKNRSNPHIGDFNYCSFVSSVRGRRSRTSSITSASPPSTTPLGTFIISYDYHTVVRRRIVPRYTCIIYLLHVHVQHRRDVL